MENKINIAELLEDCPMGMELYSPIFGKVYLDKIRHHLAIVVITDKEQGDFREEFLYDGRYGMNGECMLFPSKGKTTWEGFVPPCKFKDGDVVYTSLGNIALLTDKQIDECFSICCILIDDTFEITESFVRPLRFATEEEKAKLFQAIKDNGYKWNEATKTLEKLPKFKVGDRIKKNKDYISGIITNIYDDGSYKVEYQGGGVSYLYPEYQDEWELVPDKFDISTLKPFENRVLVRGADGDLWKPAIYGFLHPKGCYVVGGVYWRQCIPYEGNEHLIGTTNDCDDFYKTWE